MVIVTVNENQQIQVIALFLEQKESFFKRTNTEPPKKLQHQKQENKIKVKTLIRDEKVKSKAPFKT